MKKLSGPRLKRLMNAVGPGSPEVVDAAVTVLDLLVGMIEPDDGVWSLAEKRPTVWDTLYGLVADPITPDPVVVVTSGRYVAITGTHGVYDAVEGEWIDRPPKRWLETRLINVRELIKITSENIPTDNAGKDKQT